MFLFPKQTTNQNADNNEPIEMLMLSFASTFLRLACANSLVWHRLKETIGILILYVKKKKKLVVTCAGVQFAMATVSCLHLPPPDVHTEAEHPDDEEEHRPRDAARDVQQRCGR